MKKNKAVWWFAVPVLILLFAQCLVCAVSGGQAVDETFYNGSGYPIVRYNDYRILGEHPPLVMQLGSLPLLFFQPRYPLDQPVMLGSSGLFDVSKMGSKFLYGMGNDPYRILFWERLPVILITLLLGYVLFLWAYSLYGMWGAAIALVLYAFCPNVIAHGSLFTTDMAVTAFIFIGVYRLRRFFGTMRVTDAIVTGMIFGLALLSKISAIFLFPVSLALFILFAVTELKRKDPAGGVPGKGQIAMSAAAVLIFVFAAGQKIMLSLIGPACVLLVQTLFVPRNKIMTYVRYAVVSAGWITCLVSSLLLAKKSGLLISAGLLGWCAAVFLAGLWLRRQAAGEDRRFLGLMFVLVWLTAAAVIIFGYTDFPRTLPRLKPFAHYVNAFNIATSHAQSLHRVCVPASFITCDWRYFLGVMAVKTPVTVLVLAALGLPAMFFSRVSRIDKICILLPLVAFWVFASFVNRINIGVRHVLPLYPFLFLIAGFVGDAMSRIPSSWAKRLSVLAVGAGLVYATAGSLRNLPYHVSYFNEFVGDVEKGAKLTTDSNLDWGQDNKRLAEWVKANRVGSVKIASGFLNPAELQYHRIVWQPMTPEDFRRPAPGYYALGIEQYVAEQERPDSPFRLARPLAKAGRAFYIYKIG